MKKNCKATVFSLILTALMIFSGCGSGADSMPVVSNENTQTVNASDNVKILPASGEPIEVNALFLQKALGYWVYTLKEYLL